MFSWLTTTWERYDKWRIRRWHQTHRTQSRVDPTEDIILIGGQLHRLPHIEL